MKYQQTQSHRNGPNCSVEFSDYSQGEFKTSIQISFNGLQDIPDCVLVDSNDNLYADKSVLELSNDVVNEDLHLIHQEPGTPVKLVLAFKNSDLNALHIKFPPADSLEICKHLSQPDIPAASIKDIVDIGGKGDFYRILEDASQCLPPKEFVQLKDSLIMTVDWMREEVDENKYKSMINILLGQNKGSYLYRNNPRKIQEIIEHYNQNTRLENVHYSQFIQKLLQSVYDYKEIIESKDVLTDEFFIKNSREIDEIFLHYICHCYYLKNALNLQSH